MKKIFQAMMLLLPLCSLAQTNISIVVKDAAGRPLEGATVVVTGSKLQHGLTSHNGVASFKTGNASKVNITASYTGMQTIDTAISIPQSHQFIITLKTLPTALQPVEIRGLRAGSDAPFAKTDISKSFIEKNNLGQDIPFLLNQTPNVVINSDAGNGVGYTGIRIRGTDASRINMTINGIPYNDPESQGTFFVNLPDLMSSVSSIQVQRGVGTSSNGAGAFGASMNFSTHSYNPVAYAELNNSAGSFNTFKNTIKAGSGLLGKHFTIDARVSNITSDGYIERASSSLQSGLLSAGYFAGKTSIRFNAIIGKEKTYQAWNGISAADLATNRRINYAGTERKGEPYDNETDNYWQNHYQLFLNHELKSGLVFNTAFYLTTGRGYYEQYKADETLANYGIAPINGNTESDLVRRLWLRNKLFGQVFSVQQKTGNHDWTVGGGWNYYPGNHIGDVIWAQAKPALFHNWYHYKANKSDVNLYAKWTETLKNPHWKLFADLQYRFVKYNIDGFRNNPGISVNENWHFINPKAGISYNNKNWSGFLSYAMGNKEPNRDDFEAGTTQLPKPEQLHDFEFNITRNEVAKNLKLGATFYFMSYKNQLILTGKVNDVGAYTRVNIPNSYRAGAELEAAYRWANGSINYSGGFSLNKVKNFTEFIDDYDNGGQKEIFHGTKTLAFAPSLVQQASVTFAPIPQSELTWMTKYVSRQYLDNTQDAGRSLDEYITNDFRASYTIYGKKILKEARIIFQVNNLLNSMYEPNGYTFSYIYGQQLTTENYYYPMAGRNWMLGLNIRL